MIDLDGSHGEGGGSILRQALALSMLTGKEFRITNIRKNRPQPGLSAQHLAALNAAKELCGAEVTGNYLTSEEVGFKPGPVKGGAHRIDIGTAGSITLLLQSLLLPALFSDKRASFNIIGGTDVNWSSSFDYFNYVFLPQMRKYGGIETGISRRGYYPKGGGELKVVVNSTMTLNNALQPVLLNAQKKLLMIRGVSHASAELEPARVAERQAESAKLLLRRLGAPISIKTEYSRALSIGSGITLWAIFGEEEVDPNNPMIIGSLALGERNKKSELVGSEAAESLLRTIESGAAVDSHLADQLIPFMALSGGLIKTSDVTAHVMSNIYVTEKFMDVKFTIAGNVISCERQEPN